MDREITNLKNRTKKQLKKSRKLINYKWVIRISIISFTISILFSIFSEIIIPNVPIIIGIITVLIFIAIGIIFDMIGMSVASADEAIFHSMNSRRVKGAALAVQFKKNADKVSSFCNDVIGDVCGVVSGSAGVVISSSISAHFNISLFLCTLIITGIISALTIGGKAIFKSYAINKSNIILYRFAKFISNFYQIKKY